MMARRGVAVSATDSAQITAALGLAADASGALFIADYANNRIAAYYPTTPPTEMVGCKRMPPEKAWL